MLRLFTRTAHRSLPLLKEASGLNRKVSSMSSTASKVLSISSINQRVKEAQYAVRGELAIRAEAYKERLLSNQGDDLPFKEIIYCNIGNPQQLQQKPITFFRQVSALLDLPDLLSRYKSGDAQVIKSVEALFPKDAIERALEMLKSIESTGAYSHSQGIPSIRRKVAAFIESRDGGIKADPNDIFLTAGASDGVKSLLNIIISNSSVGLLLPIPQYPLYSASLTLFDGQTVPYYLNEDESWDLSVEKLEASILDARNKGVDVRAIVVINPGNPTGQCLSLDNMKQIVQLCQRQRLVLLADEVYQTNVYTPERPFHSFKKVVSTMESDVELISFHSVSKGVLGECGRRGGYFECTNIDPEVKDQLYKLASISLCPGVHGQIMVDLMVDPPKEGSPSYESYTAEVDAIYGSLKRRAEKLVAALNEMEGISCNPAQGSMYVFPRVTFPENAIKAAANAGQTPDTFYSLALLDATGVCVVPGSGFGQEPGTFHFRATFLPKESKFDAFITSMKNFHASFMNKYKD